MKRSGFLKRIVAGIAAVAVAPSIVKAEPEVEENYVFDQKKLQDRLDYLKENPSEQNNQYSYYEDWSASAVTIAEVEDHGSFVRIRLSTRDHDREGTKSYPFKGMTVMFETEGIGFIGDVHRMKNHAHKVDVYPCRREDNLMNSAIVGSYMVCYVNENNG